jgi:hypothetical protein
LALKQDRVEKHVFELQIVPKSMLEVRAIGGHHDYAVFRCARELLEACGYDVTEDFYLTDLRKAIKQHESKQEYDRIPALQKKLAKLEPLLQQQAKLEADAQRLVLAGNFTTVFQIVATELAEVEAKVDQLKSKYHNDLENIIEAKAGIEAWSTIQGYARYLGANSFRVCKDFVFKYVKGVSPDNIDRNIELALQGVRTRARAVLNAEAEESILHNAKNSETFRHIYFPSGTTGNITASAIFFCSRRDPDGKLTYVISAARLEFIYTQWGMLFGQPSGEVLERLKACAKYCAQAAGVNMMVGALRSQAGVLAIAEQNQEVGAALALVPIPEFREHA